MPEHPSETYSLPAIKSNEIEQTQVPTCTHYVSGNTQNFNSKDPLMWISGSTTNMSTNLDLINCCAIAETAKKKIPSLAPHDKATNHVTAATQKTSSSIRVIRSLMPPHDTTRQKHSNLRTCSPPLRHSQIDIVEDVCNGICKSHDNILDENIQRLNGFMDADTLTELPSFNSPDSETPLVSTAVITDRMSETLMEENRKLSQSFEDTVMCPSNDKNKDKIKNLTEYKQSRNILPDGNSVNSPNPRTIFIWMLKALMFPKTVSALQRKEDLLNIQANIPDVKCYEGLKHKTEKPYTLSNKDNGCLNRTHPRFAKNKKISDKGTFTKKNSAEDSTKKLSFQKSESEDTHHFDSTNTLSTAAIYDYIQCISAAYRLTVNGIVPPSGLLRKLAELLKLERVETIITKYPSLMDLLQANDTSKTSLASRKSKNEKEILRRRDILNDIVHGNSKDSLENFIYLPTTVRTRAAWELRLLRLRQFQTKLRQKVYLQTKNIQHPINSIGSRFTDLLACRLRVMPDRPIFSLTNASDTANTHSNSETCRHSFDFFSDKKNIGSEEQSGKQLKTSVVFGKVVSQCLHQLSHIRPENQLLRLKLDILYEELPLHFKRLRKMWRTCREQTKTLAEDTAKRVESILNRKELIREREKKERLKYLKENDFDKYLEMVKQSKNARIEELLTQTDRFLEGVTQKVALQQRATHTAREIQKHVSQTTDNMTDIPHNTGSETISELGMVKENPIQNELSSLPDVTLSSKDHTSLSRSIASNKQMTIIPDHPISNEVGRGTQLYRSVTEQGIIEAVVQPSTLIGGSLMPYQISGLQFLVNLYINDLSGILADEMGLGKTIQTIAFLAYLKEFKNVFGPHLIIVPLSTLPNWITEFERWCPSLSVIEFRGNRRERRELGYSIKKEAFNICITTYDWVIREKGILSVPYWTFIIVDEGHRMKNVRSKFHVTLSDFHSTHRLLLTGTPLQNNLSELWSLLNYLLPKIFTSAADFELWFEEPFKNLSTQDSNASDLTDEEKFLIINRLHSVLRPFLLRRVKEDVLNDLPEKREYVVRVQLSVWQQLAYEKLSNKAMRIQTAGGKVSHRSFANVMMQLRKIVNHPYLFEDEYFINDNLYRVAGKFEVLDRMLPKLMHFRHKTLIFCQMTQIMDIMDDYLELKGYERCRLDGSTIIEERRDRMLQFNDPSSSTLIFMLSTRAGGLGINLQAADTVIIFDSDWNPHQDLQAQARAHRFGQKKEVRVFRLVTVSGIEEAVLLKAQHKLDIDEKIIQAGMFNNRCTEEERQERLRMLLYSKDMSKEASVTTPQELNRFIARTEEEEDYYQAYDQKLFGHDIFRAFAEERSNIPNRKDSIQQSDYHTHNATHSGAEPERSDLVSYEPDTTNLLDTTSDLSSQIESTYQGDTSSIYLVDQENEQFEKETIKESRYKTRHETKRLSHTPLELLHTPRRRRRCRSSQNQMTLSVNHDDTDSLSFNSLTSNNKDVSPVIVSSRRTTRSANKLNESPKLDGKILDSHTTQNLLKAEEHIIISDSHVKSSHLKNLISNHPTQEELLIQSNRLMNIDEIPTGWLFTETAEEVINHQKKEALMHLDRSSRRSRLSGNFPIVGQRINTESLTDSAFDRALRRLEAGEVPDFETAVTMEKTRLDTRRSSGKRHTKEFEDETLSQNEHPSTKKLKSITTKKRIVEPLQSDEQTDEDLSECNEESDLKVKTLIQDMNVQEIMDESLRLNNPIEITPILSSSCNDIVNNDNERLDHNVNKTEDITPIDSDHHVLSKNSVTEDTQMEHLTTTSQSSYRVLTRRQSSPVQKNIIESIPDLKFKGLNKKSLNLLDKKKIETVERIESVKSRIKSPINHIKLKHVSHTTDIQKKTTPFTNIKQNYHSEGSSPSDNNVTLNTIKTKRSTEGRSTKRMIQLLHDPVDSCKLSSVDTMTSSIRQISDPVSNLENKLELKQSVDSIKLPESSDRVTPIHSNHGRSRRHRV